MIRKFILNGLCLCSLFIASTVAVFAQENAARTALLKAAESLGGLEQLRSIDNFVLTGFGQRYSTNGNISPDPNTPPKWQSVTDARRSFDLQNSWALSEERNSFQYPLAASFGHTWALNGSAQTGADMLDHPLPAVLAALDPSSVLGPVSAEAGYTVIQFTISDGETLWLGLDPINRRPYWFRRIFGDHTLGDVISTTYFTGYVPYQGVEMPLGIMTRIDWRDQVTYMLQVDSYQLNSDSMPARTASSGQASMEPGELEVVINELSAGVWDVRIPGNGQGGDGGPVIEFEDHLVMFEPYGDERHTLARVDAANNIVPGKEVTHIITTHHHGDHAGGVRGAVSRGITIIGERENEAFYRDWVQRSAVNFPDALAENPMPLKFLPVDDVLVLEDSMQRLEIYQVVGHSHMGNAVFAYLPEEKIIMEGDLGDVNWQWHWWAGALQANIDFYDIEPEFNVPVHGVVLSTEEALQKHQEQAEAAVAFCNSQKEAGIPFWGCPVKYSASGLLPLDN